MKHTKHIYDLTIYFRRIGWKPYSTHTCICMRKQRIWLIQWLRRIWLNTIIIKNLSSILWQGCVTLIPAIRIFCFNFFTFSCWCFVCQFLCLIFWFCLFGICLLVFLFVCLCVHHEGPAGPRSKKKTGGFCCHSQLHVRQPAGCPGGGGGGCPGSQVEPRALLLLLLFWQLPPGGGTGGPCCSCAQVARLLASPLLCLQTGFGLAVLSF